MEPNIQWYLFKGWLGGFFSWCVPSEPCHTDAFFFASNFLHSAITAAPAPSPPLPLPHQHPHRSGHATTLTTVSAMPVPPSFSRWKLGFFFSGAYTLSCVTTDSFFLLASFSIAPSQPHQHRRRRHASTTIAAAAAEPLPPSQARQQHRHPHGSGNSVAAPFPPTAVAALSSPPWPRQHRTGPTSATALLLPPRRGSTGRGSCGSTFIATTAAAPPSRPQQRHPHCDHGGTGTAPTAAALSPAPRPRRHRCPPSQQQPRCNGTPLS